MHPEDEARVIALCQTAPAAFHGRPEAIEEWTAELRAELR